MTRVFRGLVGVVLFGALAQVVLGHAISGTITDHDELWHLATGRLIVETGTVPARDPWTFTAGETPWLQGNWLADLLLYGLYRAGGLELDWLLGVALWLGATTLAVVRARRVASPWPVVVSAFYVLLVLGTGSAVRPQGWTFLGLALALVIIDRIEAVPTPRLGLALAGLLALAFQLHGGFAIVAAAVAIALAAGAWDRVSRKTIAVLALGLGGVVVGAALHPRHLAPLVHPARMVFAPSHEGLMTVAEALPANFRTAPGRLLELPLLALLAFAPLRKRPLGTREVVLLIAFAHLALTVTRGLHYFAIVVAAPLALTLDGALAAGRESPIRRLVLALDGLEPAARAFGRFFPHAAGIVFAIAVATSAPRLGPGVPGDLSSPRLAGDRDIAAVASWLEARDPPGRAFNELEHGGPLVWRFHGRRLVFIDGRTDLHHEAGSWERYRFIQDVRVGFEEALAREGCDLAILTRHTDLALALARRGWRTVFTSGELVVLVRPGSAADRAL